MTYFYKINQEMTWLDVLKSYQPHPYGWYRPTAFYLIYHVLVSFIDWHNVLAFKIVNL